LGRSITAEKGTAGACHLAEIVKPVRSFQKLGEEGYPIFVQQAYQPRRGGEAAEFEEIRSARPVVSVKRTGLPRSHAIAMAEMGFVEDWDGRGFVDYRECRDRRCRGDAGPHL
jgi:hypothetical protein